MEHFRGVYASAMFHVEQWPEALQRDLEKANRELSEIGGSVLTPERMEKLRLYTSLLYYWSSKMNLVSRGDREELITKHILPALHMYPLIKAIPHCSIMDFGSGSGLPGIPLKIVFPEVKFILLESRRKRAHFLKEVIRRLKLKKVEVVNERVEEYIKTYPGKVDLVVSRAAVGMKNMITWVNPVLNSHGSIVAFLNKDFQEENFNVVRVLYKRRVIGKFSRSSMGLVASMTK